jgi:hypothetical protein
MSNDMDIDQTDISFTAFYTAYIGAIKVARMRESLLGQPFALAE